MQQQTTVTLKLQIANPLLTITTTSLPPGTVGQSYGPVQLTAIGGQPPYTWGATGLPTGLFLGLNGVLSGTPAVAGTFDVTVNVTDSAS